MSGDPEGYLVHHVGGSVPGSRPTVVYLHGNGSDLSTIAGLAPLFDERGLDFAAIEYPGYGAASAQRPSQDTLVAAGRRGLEHLRAKGLSNQGIVLVGESLGSAVAAQLASEGHGARVVLISAFTSMTAMFRTISRVPVLPSALVPDRYETDSIASRITQPVLLLHSDADTVVPPSMSAELADLLPNARRVVIEGREHSGLWAAPSRTLDEVAAFATG